MSETNGYITSATVNGVPIDLGNVTFSWWSPSRNSRKKMKSQNPYVPLEIHVDKNKKVMVVKWANGEETKVTCDTKIIFLLDVGFMAALAEHVFGGKNNLKKNGGKLSNVELNIIR